MKRKTVMQDATSCDDDIRQLRENQAELGKNLEEKQIVVQQLQGTVDTLEGDVERFSDLKQRVIFINLILEHMFILFCSLIIVV